MRAVPQQDSRPHTLRRQTCDRRHQARANGEPDEIERDGQGGRRECLRPDVPDEGSIRRHHRDLRKLGQHHRPRELHSFVELDREVLASRPSRALPQTTGTGCASIICPWKSNYLVCLGRKRLLVPPR